MIGTTRANAAMPMKGVICVRISSVPYADEEMQSGREDAERDGPVESLAAQLFGDERLSEEDPLDPVARGTRDRRRRSWRARSEPANCWKSAYRPLTRHDTKPVASEARVTLAAV